MIEYIRDPKYSTREVVKLINSFRKVARYKNYSNKSVAFLYTNDNQAEKEITEKTLFTIAKNTMKYFTVILTKRIRDQYDNNFMSLKKEIEEDFRKNAEISSVHVLADYHSKNVNLIKDNLHIKCNPHQNSNTSHGKSNSEIHLERK